MFRISRTCELKNINYLKVPLISDLSVNFSSMTFTEKTFVLKELGSLSRFHIELTLKKKKTSVVNFVF